MTQATAHNTARVFAGMAYGAVLAARNAHLIYARHAPAPGIASHYARLARICNWELVRRARAN